MKKPSPSRLVRLLWAGALVFLIAIWLYPVSNRLTRAGGLALVAVVWFGLIGLCWRWRVLRFSLLGLTGLGAGFLALPARSLPDSDSLRGDYVSAVRRYEGVRYYWGGESPKGIDCSGLIRRGLIDSYAWIEADPGAGRVISVAVPANENAWFKMPMRIVRWSVFSQ